MSVQQLGPSNNADDVLNRQQQTVYKLAFARLRDKSDAEDLFQEVFLRYIKNKPTFESLEHEKAWFIRVTINCANSFFRSKKPTEELHDNIPTFMETVDPLDDYLKKLAPVHREVIHLFYYEDMSTSQIATVLKQKEATVRMQLTRARRALKQFMEEDEYDV